MATLDELLTGLQDAAIDAALEALADEWCGIDDGPTADDLDALARAIGE